MDQQVKNLPLALIILDGWGIDEQSRGNAISQANLPFFNHLIQNYTVFSLAASGEAVGLPWGEPGNSEVGHINLGAGKIIYQEVLKINKSIEDKSFFDNDTLIKTINHCKQHNSSFHIMGLLSDGGVHSHQDHMYAALELASRNGLKQVYIHVFLDGRDSPLDSGLKYIKQLEKITKRLKTGTIATISGRFYAMDRDNNWDRIEKTYKAMVKGESVESFPTAQEAIKSSYEKNVFDEEFVPCTIVSGKNGEVSRIQPGDGIFFINYRPDRAREITKAFALPTFTKFKRKALNNIFFTTMTEYDPEVPVNVVFKKESVEHPIARVWSELGLSQMHIAETEKYAHVTYFFNGGKDTIFKGQENVIVPSAGVPSYADKPEMSAKEITEKTLKVLQEKTAQVLVLNFANADMVGHTGDLQATKQAIEYVDKCLKVIIKQILKNKGSALITADHGNAEKMVNWENGHIVKEHTSSSVPCVIIGEQFNRDTPRKKDFTLDSLKVSGVLSDVTPTLLTMTGISKPDNMTSRSLL
jgi:2,3-bisphosphoglycerate-independent phosphoglycerate mutase